MTSQSITEKFCKRCNQTKPLDKFYRSVKSKDGRAFYCKKCNDEIRAAHRKTQDGKTARRRAVDAAKMKRPHRMLKEKQCKKCQQIRPAKRFDYSPQMVDGMKATCRDCLASHNRARSQKYRTKQKEEDPVRYKLFGTGHVRRAYGISPTVYVDMYVAQNGMCAVCGVKAEPEKRMLCVDHDHSTGKVRDLLCDRCNTGIGRFNDDLELLEKAKQYLLKHHQPKSDG